MRNQSAFLPLRTGAESTVRGKSNRDPMQSLVECGHVGGFAMETGTLVHLSDVFHQSSPCTGNGPSDSASTAARLQFPKMRQPFDPAIAGHHREGRHRFFTRFVSG